MKIQIGVPSEKYMSRIPGYFSALLPEEMDAWEYRKYMELVSSLVPISFGELDLASKPRLSRTLIQTALQLLRDSGNKAASWEEIEQALEAAATELLKRPVAANHFLFPLPVAIAPNSDLNVMGKVFARVDSADVYEWPAWTQLRPRDLEAKALLAKQDRFSFFVASHDAADPTDAADLLSLHLDFLRGAINLELLGDSFETQFGPAKPLTRCPPPPLVLAVDDSRNLLNSYGPIYGGFDYRRQVVNQDVLDALVELMARAHSSPADLRSLLFDAIVSYGDAVDCSDRRMAFLGFWQITEALTIARDGASMQDVANRMKHLIKAKPWMGDLIDVQAQARNHLVHMGSFASQDLSRVNYAKWISEYAIRRLLYLTDKLPSRQHVLGYCQAVELPETELKRRAEVIAFIQDERAEKA